MYECLAIVIFKRVPNMKVNTLSYIEAGLIGFILRVGLGAVFIIGGISKLSLLLDTSTHNAMVANYMSTSGYINEMFQQFLFTGMLGNLISPSSFLISLSVFELLSGVALVVGFMVRPLSLIYAFLLWAFVIALPTMTVPGMEIASKTYTSPA
ncbi:MAG: putative membrane protein YphA (DoxX/SURF4 family), partial [Oceanospirillaceae bacterium]